MTTQLVISSKVLSLRGRMNVTNPEGQELYSAQGEWALWNPAWRILKGTREVATIKRRMFSWTPRWDITGQLGTFVIERQLFSFVRNYRVVGGPFDGARTIGNFWDLKFRIERGAETIAQASASLFSIRNRHSIEVHPDRSEGDAEAELLTVIAMVTMKHDQRQRNSSRRRHGR